MSRSGSRRLAILGAFLLIINHAPGAESSPLNLQPREAVTLPEAGVVLLRALVPIEGTETVLVSAMGRDAESERPRSIVWKIEDGTARQVLADQPNEMLEGCVASGKNAALCVFLSDDGSLRTGILALDDDSLRGLKNVDSIVAETIQGIAPRPGEGALVWGMAGLHPFAAMLDAEGELLWSFRWEQFELGEFYDGVVAEEGARLLARSRSEQGASGRIFEVRVTAAGQLAETRSVANPNEEALPLLVPGSTEQAAATDDAKETAPRVLLLEGGPALSSGLLDWTRLDSQTVVHLALDGMTTAVVVRRGDGEEARAPVAGLPFSGLVAGSGRRIYVLTTDFERTPPPKQVLRLSGFELDG